MTAAREAILLPCLFLTIAVVAALRFGTVPVLAPPSLFALVLAVVFGVVLVQSGTLDPLRLMNAARPALANANGATALLAMFVASAQIFSLLTPEFGLPRVLFNIYFLVFMFQTMAAAPDRPHVMRSVAVTLGAAFVLKFIVLDALSDPAGGRLARALQMLVDGMTLGALSQRVQHPAAGYIAFIAVVLFLVAMSLLPRRGTAFDERARLDDASSGTKALPQAGR
jgi:hypothetical protein